MWVLWPCASGPFVSFGLAAFTLLLHHHRANREILEKHVNPSSNEDVYNSSFQWAVVFLIMNLLLLPDSSWSHIKLASLEKRRNLLEIHLFGSIHWQYKEVSL
jgi:hypothetical protein